MGVHLASGTQFDWHHGRRVQELPTITTLVGPNSLGLREWRGWNTVRQRATVVGADLKSVAAAWFETLKAGVDIIAAAISWVADHSHSDGRPDPARMTPFDLDRLWHSVPDANSDPVAAIAYRILFAAIRVEPFDDVGILRQLGPIPFLAGFCGLIPESLWPAILLIEVDRFEIALGDLERLTIRVLRLPIGICVSSAIYDSALASPRRIMALAREGEIRLVGVSTEILTNRLQAAGVPEPLPVAAIRYLASAGLAPEVADAYVVAATESRRPANPQDSEDVHRSASDSYSSNWNRWFRPRGCSGRIGNWNSCTATGSPKPIWWRRT